MHEASGKDGAHHRRQSQQSAARSRWRSPRRRGLVLNTRANRERMEAVAAECRKAGVGSCPSLGEHRDAAAVGGNGEAGARELGAIDVLVCNAAIRAHGACRTSLEDWHRVIGVNPHSAFYLARAVVPGDEGARARQHHRHRRAIESDRAAQHRSR